MTTQATGYIDEEFKAGCASSSQYCVSNCGRVVSYPRGGLPRSGYGCHEDDHLGTDSDWRPRTSRLLSAVDAFVVIWAVVGAYVIRFGLEPNVELAGSEPNYIWVSAAIAIIWWYMLGAWNSRQSRILGSGPDEYKRVAAASLWLFGLVAIFSYVFRIETARGYVGIALPVGLVGLLLARWLLRQHLHLARQKGSSMSRLLLLGGPSAVAHLAASLYSAKHAGYVPVAAYTPGVVDKPTIEPESGLPILGHGTDTRSVLEAIDACKLMQSPCRQVFSSTRTRFATLDGNWLRATLGSLWRQL